MGAFHDFKLYIWYQIAQNITYVNDITYLNEKSYFVVHVHIHFEKFSSWNRSALRLLNILHFLLYFCFKIFLNLVLIERLCWLCCWLTWNLIYMNLDKLDWWSLCIARCWRKESSVKVRHHPVGVVITSNLALLVIPYLNMVAEGWYAKACLC